MRKKETKKKSNVVYTKATALKNFRNWTDDQDLLKVLLDTDQLTFTDDEIKALVSKEIKRKVK